ncbi:hypothetical protein AVEN_127956-1, partial [Araneus ventricosus]
MNVICKKEFISKSLRPIRSRPVYLSGGEAGVLMAVADHISTPPVGGRHYHRQRASPNHYCTHQGSETRLVIRRLLTHVLVVRPSGA